MRRRRTTRRSAVGGWHDRRRVTTLKVNTRLGRRPDHPHRTLVVGVSLAALAAVCVLTWLGMRKAVRVLFAENDRYTIRRLVINEGTVVTGSLLREWTQLAEGMNLFSFSSRRLRRSVMSRAANIRSLEITRRLPDSLEITVAERVPLARLGRRGAFVCDREGAVFSLGLRQKVLPQILSDAHRNLRPGSRLEAGMTLAALELIEVCDDPRIGLDIESVRVDRETSLLVRGTFGGRSRTMDFSWPEMGKRSAASRRFLLEQLGAVLGTLRSPQGRTASALDATFNGRIVARQ